MQILLGNRVGFFVYQKYFTTNWKFLTYPILRIILRVKITVVVIMMVSTLLYYFDLNQYMK